MCPPIPKPAGNGQFEPEIDMLSGKFDGLNRCARPSNPWDNASQLRSMDFHIAGSIWWTLLGMDSLAFWNFASGPSLGMARKQLA